MHTVFRLVVAVSCVLAAAGAAHAEPRVVDESWAVTVLQGQPAGHMVSRTVHDAGRIISTVRFEIEVGRAGQPITIAIDSRFVETADHQPLEAGTTMDLGAMAMRTHVRFDGDKMHKTTTQAGQSRRQTLPAPDGDWLTPAQAKAYERARLNAGDPEFSYTTFNYTDRFDLEQVNARRVGRQAIDVFGKTVPATHLKVATESQPGLVSDVWVDDQAHQLKTSINLGGIALDVVAADKELALAKKTPPEMLNDTLIRLDRPIDNPRGLTEATYRLTMSEGDLPDLPESPAQAVQRIDARSAIVTIDLAARDRPAAEPPPDPPVTHSAMADGRDEKVKALVAQAATAADAPPSIEDLRRFVHGYIDAKNLSVGMATAGEVARTRQGDCTEHAVLLAAMCRAINVPSRLASGLVYVDNWPGMGSVFGYHAWTQAWVDGRWIDLDAALSDDHAFDATHILLSTTDLADGRWTNDVVKMADLIGRLKIEPVD